jgi:hypothetical protein
MRHRKTIAKILQLLLLILSFVQVEFRRAAHGAEPEFALIVRSEDGQETRMSMGDIANLPCERSRQRRKG